MGSGGPGHHLQRGRSLCPSRRGGRGHEERHLGAGRGRAVAGSGRDGGGATWRFYGAPKPTINGTTKIFREKSDHRMWEFECVEAIKITRVYWGWDITIVGLDYKLTYN